jgi:hypothetical protein
MNEGVDAKQPDASFSRILHTWQLSIEILERQREVEKQKYRHQNYA